MLKDSYLWTPLNSESKIINMKNWLHFEARRKVVCVENKLLNPSVMLYVLGRRLIYTIFIRFHPLLQGDMIFYSNSKYNGLPLISYYLLNHMSVLAQTSWNLETSLLLTYGEVLLCNNSLLLPMFCLCTTIMDFYPEMWLYFWPILTIINILRCWVVNSGSVTIENKHAYFCMYTFATPPLFLFPSTSLFLPFPHPPSLCKYFASV